MVVQVECNKTKHKSVLIATCIYYVDNSENDFI